MLGAFSLKPNHFKPDLKEQELLVSFKMTILSPRLHQAPCFIN